MATASQHFARRQGPKNGKQTDGYRWFQLWIGIGLVLAVLLLASSISTYVLVSRRLIVEHLRGDLASQVAIMDQQIQRGTVENSTQFAAMLQQAQASNRRIAWILIRSGDGTTVAQAGSLATAAFSNQYVWSRLASRQPIFKTLHTVAGSVLVEVFPFRLPGTITAAEFPSPVQPGRKLRPFGTLEIGAFLEGAGAALWPLKRNLIIDASAALVLLISLAVIALRLRSYVAGRHLEQEVEIARNVQRDLLPSSKRDLDGFELAADCVPAAGVSGDFYDIFPARGDRAAFIVGDVSGKGVPAALLMGVMHGAVRSSSWTQSLAQHQEASQQINRLLCERAASERFASMFWSYFDPESQHLKYINAGHCAPFLLKATRRDIVLRLTIGGPVLGLLPDAEFQQGSVRLEPGDVLVLYSDGIVEAANPQDEEFGEDRVLAIVRKHRKDTAEEIRNRILSAVEVFTGRIVPEDDRTLLVIVYSGAAKRTGSNEASRELAERAA